MRALNCASIVLVVTAVGCADTVELNQPSVSINGRVSYQGDKFRIEIDAGKVVEIDSAQVKQVWFNDERPTKKAPPLNGPIVRGLADPQWRIQLKDGTIQTGPLETITDRVVILHGKEPIQRGDVVTIAVVKK